MPIEVAPIAHYHMGGVAADVEMQTDLRGLFAAGEVVGGANGANRLSGNAVTEALVFGRRAGRSAARFAKRARRLPQDTSSARGAIQLISSSAENRNLNTAEVLQLLQNTMQDSVGPLRTRTGLIDALDTINRLTRELGDCPPGGGGRFDMQRLEWFDLRNMLLVARVVAEAALSRTETRGAHQREDYPRTMDEWTVNQHVTLNENHIVLSKVSPQLAAVP